MEQTINLSPISFSRDTIVAVSTAPGTGGIAVIRISGPEALDIAGSVWRGKSLKNCESHTAHLGKIVDENGDTLDEVVATIFLAPNSFTGDDTIELACHGSRWIQREIVNLLIRSGARSADRGEFSQRAFINGKLDLAQAEGIADLIASSSKAAHRLAMTQVTGHFSRHLDNLRNQLIEFASLLELELDFSEEDVEFADRIRLRKLADSLLDEIDRLARSYATGKVFKEGIPVVIAGQPNAGKSTLLNYLLDDDKAIVSDIPGTTRDIIEDTREIDGILFRFIDTAGLRSTNDAIEKLGIERASDRIKKAALILWVIDTSSDIDSQMNMIRKQAEVIGESIPQYFILNKCDLNPDIKTESLIETFREQSSSSDTSESGETQFITLSAATGEGLPSLLSTLIRAATGLQESAGDLMVTNARHYESLVKGGESLRRARRLLDDHISADFIAQDVREALHHLGEITGTISSSTLLHSIFSRFCIGK